MSLLREMESSIWPRRMIWAWRDLSWVIEEHFSIKEWSSSCCERELEMAAAEVFRNRGVILCGEIMSRCLWNLSIGWN